MPASEMDQPFSGATTKPADNDAWLRTMWLAKTKQSRARRGQPPELTDEERDLSQKDALELHLREAQVDDEERHRARTIKQLRSSQIWFLLIAAGGILLATFLYAGVVQHWLSERLLQDLWALSIMAMAAGPVLAGLQHLELRALLLGTERARKQSAYANMFFGTVMFLAFAVFIAVSLAFEFFLLIPWPELSPSLGNLLAGFNNGSAFFSDCSSAHPHGADDNGRVSLETTFQPPRNRA